MISYFLRIFHRFRLVLATIFAVGVAGDIFLNSRSDINLLLLCLLWVLIIKLFNFKSAMTFKVALIFLAILFFLFIISPSQGHIERVATWVVLFLVLGIVQQFGEVTS